MLGPFNAEVRAILPTLGKPTTCSNARAREVLQMDFIAPGEAVCAAVRFMVENGRICLIHCGQASESHDFNLALMHFTA